MPIKFRNAPSYSVELGHMRIEAGRLVEILERCDAKAGIKVENGNARVDGLDDVRANPEYLFGTPIVILRQAEIRFKGETVAITGTLNDDALDRDNVQHIQRMLEPYVTVTGKVSVAITVLFLIAIVTIPIALGISGGSILPEMSFTQGAMLFGALALVMQIIWIVNSSATRNNVFRDGSKAFWRMENPFVSATLGAIVASTITWLLN